MSTKYRYEFTPDAFKQNFRNLLEDLEALSASIVSTLAQAVLLAGRAGGQAIISGTLNDQRLGIGANPSFSLDVQVTQNTMTIVRSKNVSTGTAGEGRLRSEADVARAELTSTGSGYTAFAYFGTTPASWSFCAAATGNGLGVGTLNSSPLLLGTNNLGRMLIDANGNVEIGTAALATSATNGFLYIPSCAGTPTGTPTAKTGRVPLVYDTTNNKLYVYNGAWKSVTLA